MPSYTTSQVNALQGYITGANAALAAGDTQNALNYINLYYQNQTSMRGYATDALSVINDQGLFGAVANQTLINALGASQYAASMPKIAVDLASADFGLIKNNPNQVPTENEISKLC